MRSKSYLINITPKRWARPGVNYSKNHFFDTQKNEKLAYGLSIIRDHNDEPLFEGPLSLDVTFFMTIPKLKRKRGLTCYHATTPDLDNLCKLLLDSITQTSVVWTDDKQVSQILAIKRYDAKPRVEFTISELK
jgi:Holliday junction resolvase RusA-like endonuclease